MSPTIRRIIIGFVSVLLIVCVLAAVFGFLTVRRSFPQTDGNVQVSGLDAPVDIYRDEFGIPHIYASTRHDLFFAQGYVHAQDRFWQMDFWRHIGSARLSEMFGESQLDTDKFLRTLGWARIAEKELESMDPESRANLDAYAQGVNAYLEDHTGSELSLEYSILKLMNADYQPEPWQPLHTVTWGKVMAWDLGGNLDAEIQRALLLKTLTQEQVDEIIPPYPVEHPNILPGFQLGGGVKMETTDVEALYSSRGLERGLIEVSDRIALVKAVLGSKGGGIGSNSWVISGDLTATGQPLLANDPHLGIQMPSIWYEIGLHCVPKGPDCGFNVTGFSFPSAPGVILGHNDRIAWGVTNLGPDVQDLYIEKINPENPNQYEVNAGWVDMDLFQETIHVAGGEPVEITVRTTRHGPIISETYSGLEDFTINAGIELPANYALSLRWTALEPASSLQAFWELDLAENWDDFRAAAARLDVPSQNIVYADIEGNIGYQSPGKIPMRENGDGSLPVPGWTDEYEWSGFIPFEELPYVYNPSEGYIATANNAVVSEEYPHLLSLVWAYGYRAQRIVEMIEGAPGPIDIAYIQKMQGDNKNLNAEVLVPLLLDMSLNDGRLLNARDILVGWDYQDHMDSPPAGLFNVFWKNLLSATFNDDLPEDYWPGGGSRWFTVVAALVDQPDSPWWDNQGTPQIEPRDNIFLHAFSAAVDEIETLGGKDPSGWRWGNFHTSTFRNQTLGESGIAPIEGIFNRGPFATSGGSSIVNATSWDAVEAYTVAAVPSMRMIVDISDLEYSVSMHTTGQSGHAYHPHYIDMAGPWRLVQYHPMYWERSAVEASSTGHLHMTP